MPSLRAALSSVSPPVSSAAEHAARMGLSSPVSIRELMLASDIRVFEKTIVTPSGTALGGFVKLVVAGNGRYIFSGHMHGSGFDPYKFSIHLFLRGTFIGLSLRKSGSVGGTLDNDSRDFDWSETGVSEALRAQWPALRDGSMDVAKSYENTGLLGAAQDIGSAFLEFWVANVLVGPQIAGLVVIGSELAQLASVHVDPDTFAGALVAGGTVLLCGPGMLIPAAIAGVGVGLAIESRHLRSEEEAVARSVFANTLDFSRIYITNLERPDGKRFVVPQWDGSILVNMGRSYDDPITSARYTLIHELVHAWQCMHAMSLETAWQFATNPVEGDSAYSFEYAEEHWPDMNIEAQASAVSTWFYIFENFPEGGLNSVFAINSPLYKYVAEHIRLAIN